MYQLIISASYPQFITYKVDLDTPKQNNFFLRDDILPRPLYTVIHIWPHMEPPPL